MLEGVRAMRGEQLRAESEESGVIFEATECDSFTMNLL